MSRLLRNLFLVCSPILLAGCQSPLAPPAAGVNGTVVDAGAHVRVEKAIQPPAPAVAKQVAVMDVSAPASPKTQAPLMATVQKQPESQTGQLADGLMLVFTTFTGH